MCRGETGTTNGRREMSEKIKTRLMQMRVGCVAVLWDLLVYRVAQDAFIIGDKSIQVDGNAVCLEDGLFGIRCWLATSDNLG